MRLQLESIWRCTTQIEVRATLRELPSDLKTLYARSFSKIVSDIGLRSLRWVYGAPQPFKTAELCEFLAIDTQTGSLLPEQIVPKSVIIEECFDLIRVNVNDEVVLVHQSLRRFLQTIEGSLIWNLKEVQQQLGWLCLKYLTGPGFTLAVDHRREKVSIPYDGRTLVQQVFDLPRILQPRSTRPARAVTVSPQALGMVRNRARGPSHALAFARQSWLPLTRQITVHEPHWTLFLELALRPNEEFKIHPWECQPLSIQSHYGKLLGWSIAHSHLPLFQTLSHAKNPKPRREIYDIPLPEYRNLFPLHLAARIQDEAVADQTANNGDIVSDKIFKDILARVKYQRDERNYTALHHAAEAGNARIVKRILDQRGALGGALEDKDDHKRTALVLAALGGHDGVLQILLDLGADSGMSYVTEDNLEPRERPLMGAAKYGHTSTVKALLRSDQARKDYINAVDSKSRTALHYTAKFPTKQSGAIVRLLLQARADHDKRDTFGSTALELACKEGNISAAEALLTSVVPFDAKLPAFIDIAIRSRDDTTIQTFSNAGGFDSNRHPPLEPSQFFRLDRMPLKELQDYVRILKNCGVNLNAVDAEGRTPLMHAVIFGMGSLAEILLSYKDIALQLQDQNGDTALHLVMNNLTKSPHIFSDERVDRLFIQQHVSEHFEIPNSLGLTPLSLVLLCEDAQKVFTTEELHAILAPGRTLNNAVDSLSNYRFGQRISVADGIYRVVRNLQFFSSLVPVTAPHMGFIIDAHDALEEIQLIEGTIRGLRMDPITLPMSETRYCRLHSTSTSLHYKAGVLFKDVEATICLVPR